MSRNCFKDLCWFILFSGEKKLRNLNIKGMDKEIIEDLMFGYSGKKLINDLKKIGLNDLIDIRVGRKKKYKRGKNISLILMKMENYLMDLLRNILIRYDYKFISVFDSFIVKKNEGKKILRLLNSELSNVDRVLRFKMKDNDLKWEFYK